MHLVRGLLVVVLAVGLVGCTDEGPDATTQPSGRPSVVDGTAGSDAAEPCTPMPWGNNVVEGRSDDGHSVVALVQPGPDGLAGAETLQVGQSVKVVVRITGAGDLAVAVKGPAEAERALDWGPEAHLDSTFDHPGDEWGVGFTPDRPGCWTVAFTRAGEGTGYVQLAAA